MEFFDERLTSLNDADFLKVANSTIETLAYLKTNIIEIKKQNPSFSADDLAKAVLIKIKLIDASYTIDDAKTLIAIIDSNLPITELEEEAKRRNLGVLKDALAKQSYTDTLAQKMSLLKSSMKSSATKYLYPIGIALAGGGLGFLIAKKMKKSPLYGFLIGTAVTVISAVAYVKIKGSSTK